MGAPVDVLTFDGAVAAARDMALKREKPGFVVAINPEKVMTARGNRELMRFIRRADLAIPDGIGVVCAAKTLFGEKLERVPGADLMQELCRISGKEGIKIFLFGAKEEASAAAVRKLRERYPDVMIVGRENGYLPEDRYDELVERVNASGANALFLALGSPKQERWAQRYGASLNVGLCMGIGGTLDTIAGTVKRAPLSWQKLRVEWLYRLIRQPSRFWRQRRIFIFGAWVLVLKLTGYGRRWKSPTVYPRVMDTTR